MTKLAILGGTPEIGETLTRYQSIGPDEAQAVQEVIESGCLSGFYGRWGDGFEGGPQIQNFENEWCTRFNATHCVSVNSNTSGLYAAMGAVGVSPGDEVIVPATSMSATAMAPIIYGGIPVFGDLDLNTYCLDINSVKQNLTSKTRAIIAVNLFGHPAELHALRALCDEKGIFLIEDNAQAVRATENGVYTGTIGHIGVFSLNYHKHIHTGEGGMCTTNDPDLALKLKMIRNHAEAIVEAAHIEDLTNMVGFNFRMTELSAAIGRVQLKNLDQHIGSRIAFAEQLSAGLSGLIGITTPVVREGCTHSYYNWTMNYDADSVGVSRKSFVDALKHEGTPFFEAYARPLYFLPIFQQKQAIGRYGYPFNLTDREYPAGLCPNAENLFNEQIISMECCAYQFTPDITQKLINAFLKVYENREQLKTL